MSRCFFSGDLGGRDTPLLPDPDIPESCDLLVLESTYGDRNHRLERLGGGPDPLPGRRRPGACVFLDGGKYDHRARVHQLSGYSAHADQADLLAWVAAMQRPPGKIKLVHGEAPAQWVLAEKLRAATGCEVA